MKKQLNYNGFHNATSAIKLWLLTLFIWAWIGSWDNVHIIPATGFLSACMLSINLIVPFFLIMYMSDIFSKNRLQKFFFIFFSGLILIHTFTLFCSAFFTPLDIHHTIFLHYSIAMSYSISVGLLFSVAPIRMWLKSLIFRFHSIKLISK